MYVYGSAIREWIYIVLFNTRIKNTIGGMSCEKENYLYVIGWNVKCIN